MRKIIFQNYISPFWKIFTNLASVANDRIFTILNADGKKRQVWVAIRRWCAFQILSETKLRIYVRRM